MTITRTPLNPVKQKTFSIFPNIYFCCICGSQTATNIYGLCKLEKFTTNFKVLAMHKRNIFHCPVVSDEDHLLCCVWVVNIRKLTMKIKVLISLLCIIGIARCAENSVSINVKNVANTVSDRFISYEINFSDLMNLFLEQKSVKNLSLISPAYIKLQGFSAYLRSDKSNKFNEADVATLVEYLKWVSAEN